METKYSKLPWRMSEETYGTICDSQGSHIACVDYAGIGGPNIVDANAAFIVRACNSYEAMREALEAMLDVASVDDIDKSGLADVSQIDFSKMAMALIKARDALALANGESV